MAQTQLTQHIKFFIGIIYVLDIIHKPCVAMHVWILQWYLLTVLQRQDKIFGIEHVEHREDAVAIHLCHISSGLGHGTIYLVHLRMNVSLYKFLISAQLSRMIATDTLEVV